MANTYKNIVITPNSGSTTDDPKIVFSGANTSVNTDITLRVYPTSNGTVSLEGSAGQLFSITNQLTGTIYSVNDISGIPSIEVLDNGDVKLAQYNGNVLIGTGTDNNVDKFQIVGSANATSLSVRGYGPVINTSGYWIGAGSTGTSGYSGYSGSSGISGYSGYSGKGYDGLTSTTSTTIATGSKAFTVNQTQGTNAYVVGARVRVASSASPANFMEGSITAYTTTTLTVNVDLIGGSGTIASWNISITGSAGTSGYSGYSGSGISGYSGYSGSGISGYSGYSGSGVSGYSGYSGSGISGYSGYSGSGISGYSGYSGTSGISGYSGYSGSGISGYSGYSGSGISGYSGYSGSGISGYSGYSGSGISGYSGYSGSGVSGYSGYSGSGISGYSGYSGSGVSGYSGYSGSGISGYSGYSGSGVSGYSGYSGWSGPTGTGTSGYSGYSGAAGYGTLRILSQTTTATLAINSDSYDAAFVTALAGTMAVSAPTGSPSNGQKIIIRIKDNGTIRSISWTTTSGGWRPVATVLPTVTIANKTLYVAALYNTEETYWDVIAVAQQA